MKKIHEILDEELLGKLYYVAVFIYSFRMAFRNSLIIQFSSYTKLLIYGLLFLLLIPKVILQKYNRKQIAISAIVLGFSLVAYYINRTRNLLIIPLILIGVKDCDIKRVIRMVFIATVCFVIIHTAGYFIDHFINGGTLYNIPFFVRDGNERSTVLCKSYNNYGAITSMATIQYLFLTNRKNRRNEKTISLVLLSIFFYAIGTSRTSLIISLLVVSFLLVENNDFVTCNLKPIKLIVFIICCFFSFSMFYIKYDGGFWMFADKLLSGRISLASLAKEMYGLSLWPQIGKLLDNPIYIDNYVVYLTIVYGFLFTAVFLLCIYIINKFSENETIIDYFTIVTFFWAVTERYLAYVTLTIVPLITIYNYYRKYEE